METIVIAVWEIVIVIVITADLTVTGAKVIATAFRLELDERFDRPIGGVPWRR